MNEQLTPFDEVLEEIADGTDAYAEEKTFITDDNIAEWALRKIKAEQEEQQRLNEVAENAIRYYQDQISKTNRRYESRIGNLKLHLNRYFETVPHRKLKASEQYALPSGKLSVKYGKIKHRFVDGFGNDDKNGNELIAWLEAYGYDQFVKVSKAVDWAGLSKVIEAVGTDYVMRETGEYVDGITAYKTDDEFEVKT